MKHKFLIAILCLGMLTAYYSCQKDDAVTKEEQTSEVTKPVFKTLSYETTDATFNRLKDEVKITKYLKTPHSSSLQGKSMQDTLGLTIATDIIKQVTLGDYTSYTMKIVHQSDSTVFYNLTIEDKNGVSGIFITKFTPTEYWLNNKDKPYEGDVVVAKTNVFTNYSDVEEVFDDLGINDDNNPGLGSGPGGTNSGNDASPYYPSDCDGLVIVTTEEVPYSCSCDPSHMPWEICHCDEYGGTIPGYELIPMYYCQTYSDVLDPDDPNNTGGNDNYEEPEEVVDIPESIIIVVDDKECLTEADRPFDYDDSCSLDYYESCRKNGNSHEVCECASNGGTLEDCIFEEVASTALFKKKGDDDEAVPVILEFVLPCFDTENNQNGYHDVTIYVKQPVPNSTEISTGLGDAGHTFIELTQALNGNIVRQYIGLYPADDDVSPNNPLVDGIFIDDSEEEYDVSLKVELSPEQFNNIIDYLMSFGELNEYGGITDVDPEYDLNEFNCSDFGLDIMNLSDIQIPDSTGEWGGEYGYDLGQGTCPALLGQDIRNTNFGSNVVKDLDGGVSGNSTENLCDD